MQFAPSRKLNFNMSPNKLKLLLNTLALTILVYSINIYFSPDFSTYHSNWQYFTSLDYSELLWSVLTLLSKFLFSNYYIYLFLLSFIVLYYKLKYLKLLTKSDLVIIFYISSFLFLHEAIQIRLALGLIFVLKSFKLRFDGRIYKSFVYLTIASLIHLSLLFYFVVLILRLVTNNKFALFLLFSLIAIFYSFISYLDNIELLMGYISEGGEDWSLKLANYLYEFLEIGTVKTPPLQLYYVSIVYFTNLVFNFKDKNEKLNELSNFSLILAFPLLLIPNDTMTSRFLELCFYFLPIVQFQIVSKLTKLRLSVVSFSVSLIFILLNLKIFTNQLFL